MILVFVFVALQQVEHFLLLVLLLPLSFGSFLLVTAPLSPSLQLMFVFGLVSVLALVQQRGAKWNGNGCWCSAL